MLSILHPEIMGYVRDLPIGLFPVVLERSAPKLVIKASKETLLTAKMNKGFSLYLVPYGIGSVFSLGFLAAFFDDADEPLTVGGAIIQEFSAEAFRILILSTTIDVFLFDELNREHLGYRAKVTATNRTREAIRTAVFPSIHDVNQGKVLDSITNWFANRTSLDDSEAVTIEFLAPKFPEGVIHLDLEDAEAGPTYLEPVISQLERHEPGELQEREIVKLLRRSFPSARIYWSPRRSSDREEIADIVLESDQSILFVQAKDSPNTERILKNTIARKRATTNGAMMKAVRQMRGALGYMKRGAPMEALIGDDPIQIDWSSKSVFGLVVLKELFSDDYDIYTPPLLQVSEATGVPCIVLSYNELHQYTTHLMGDDAFFGALMRVFEHGCKTGMFPQLRLRSPEPDQGA